MNIFRRFVPRASPSEAPIAPELVAMISVIGGDRVLRQWFRQIASHAVWIVGVDGHDD